MFALEPVLEFGLAADGAVVEDRQNTKLFHIAAVTMIST
jgi:hypothetical protein